VLSGGIVVSIPERMFVYRIFGNEIRPTFLSSADHPWLRRLINELDRSIGEPARVAEERLAAIDLGSIPEGLKRMAQVVLLAGVRTRAAGNVPARQIRSMLFRAAGRSSEPRPIIIESVARDLSVTPDEVEECLFADLAGERRVVGYDAALTPEELALRVNLAFVQSILFRSTQVRLAFEGNARAIVRSAKLGGLLCTVMDGTERSGVAIEISGPFSLFRRTHLYGRALSAIVPFLAWTRRFELTAECCIRGRVLELQLKSPAPIFPSAEPRAFDSRVEERFVRRFARIAKDWELIREPEPVRASGTLIFPDFIIQHRHDPARGAWIEIVGFWSPQYLTQKLERLRAAKLPNLILCIDEDLACGDGAAPEDAQILRFRRRLDPALVLGALSARFSDAGGARRAG
jgi:uncharacterized protein